MGSELNKENNSTNNQFLKNSMIEREHILCKNSGIPRKEGHSVVLSDWYKRTDKFVEIKFLLNNLYKKFDVTFFY